MPHHTLRKFVHNKEGALILETHCCVFFAAQHTNINHAAKESVCHVHNEETQAYTKEGICLCAGL